MTNVKKFPIMAVGRANAPYLTKDLLAAYKGCGCTVAEAIMDDRIPNPIPAGMEMPEYLDRAEKNVARSLLCAKNAGIDVMVRLDDPGSATLVSSAFQNTLWRSRWNSCVEKFNSETNVYGWMLMDQPNEQAMASVGACSAMIRAKDPIHPVYVNLYPPFATDLQLFGRGGSIVSPELYDLYSQRARTQLDPDIWSNSDYRVTVVNNKLSVWPSYFSNLLNLNTASIMSGKPFWGYVKTSEPLNSFPSSVTVASLRFQIYTALAFGAKGLVYNEMAPDKVMNAPLTTGTDGLLKTTWVYDCLKAIHTDIENVLPHLLEVSATDIRVLLKTNEKSEYIDLEGQAKVLYDDIAPFSTSMPTVKTIKSLNNSHLIISRLSDADSASPIESVDKKTEGVVNSSSVGAAREIIAVVNPDMMNDTAFSITFDKPMVCLRTKGKIQTGSKRTLTLKAGEGVFFIA